MGDVEHAANAAFDRVAQAMDEVAGKDERLLSASQKLSAVSMQLSTNAEGTSGQASAVTHPKSTCNRAPIEVEISFQRALLASSEAAVFSSCRFRR